MTDVLALSGEHWVGMAVMSGRRRQFAIGLQLNRMAFRASRHANGAESRSGYVPVVLAVVAGS